MSPFVSAARIGLVFLIACRVVELVQQASLGGAFSATDALFGVLLLVLAVLGLGQAAAARLAAERIDSPQSSARRLRRLHGRRRRMSD